MAATPRLSSMGTGFDRVSVAQARIKGRMLGEEELVGEGISEG